MPNLVPDTVADMKPPKASSLVNELASFMRAHWLEIKPYYEIMSGKAPSKHGSFALDEADCLFKIQEMASHNGYAYIGAVKAVKLKSALHFAYKRNTGHVNRLLQDGHKQALLAAAEGATN